MATGDDYVNNDMLDPDGGSRRLEKVFGETTFRKSKTFSRTMNPKEIPTEPKL